jgi:transcriptional regulator with XRE-family HTH domain
MSSKKWTIASAIVELRSTFEENQQKFSDRLGVALATVARWEIDNRQPSPRYLKELWHLAAEQDRADLAQIFADAFAAAVGYALSGETGYQMRRLISDIRNDAGALLFEGLPPSAREHVENIVRAAEQLKDVARNMDIEPPFRAFIPKVKGKLKK